MITKKQFIEYFGEFKEKTVNRYQTIYRTKEINNISLMKKDNKIFLNSWSKIDDENRFATNIKIDDFNDIMEFTEDDFIFLAEDLKRIISICDLIEIELLETQMIEDTKKLPCSKTRILKF